jgi:hypothetical protein
MTIIKDIKQKTGNQNIEFLSLNLEQLSSVKEAAQNLLSRTDFSIDST